MPNVKYGNSSIEYTFELCDNLKSHYISVEKGKGVTLKGKSISVEKQDVFILKKARWILDKLKLVSAINHDDIVTGSRVQYLGRRYYVQILASNKKTISIDFTASKFKVYVPKELNNQQTLQKAFEQFLRKQAIEKITARIKRWSQKIGLKYNELKIRKLEKRWGSCTPSNNIIINADAIKLPYRLIDYILVHELVHTKIKNHTKEFWAELSKYIPNYKELDDRMLDMKV